MAPLKMLIRGKLKIYLSMVFFRKKSFKKITRKILDHKSPMSLDDSEWKHFLKYMSFMRKFTNEFKVALNSLKSNAYVIVYQAAGNSVRRTGGIHPDYDAKDFDPSCVYHLPKTINRVIKVIRKTNGGKAHIVIDAIRNPYEVRYFKDRYSSFYLVSINASDNDRKSIYKMSTSILWINLI